VTIPAVPGADFVVGQANLQGSLTLYIADWMERWES
jgi:hypothetical protein